MRRDAAASIDCVRPYAARRLPRFLALLLVPFTVAAALCAGFVYVILLPICGIGSIAESLARAAWRQTRAALHPSTGVTKERSV